MWFKKLKLLKKFRTIQIKLLFTSMLSSVFSIIQIILLGKVVDNLENIVPLMIFFSLQIIVKFSNDFLVYFYNKVQIFSNIKMHKTLSKALISKISKLDYAIFENKSMQNLMYFVSNKPHEKMMNSIISINSLISIILNLIIILVMIIRVSFIAAFLTGLLLIGIVYMNYKTIRIYNLMYFGQSEKERWNAYYSDLLNNKNDFLNLKIRNAITISVNNIKRFQDEIVSEKFVVALKSKKYYLVSIIFTIMMLVIILGSITYNTIVGGVSLGVVLSTIAFLPKLMTYSDQCGFIISNLGENIEVINKFISFMALEELNEPEQLVQVADGIAVEFKGVWFKYPNDDHWIIKDVSFKIEKGEKIGVVGKNGSGKSTLMHLLLGLYSPQKGQIFLNGIPLSSYHYSDISKNIAVVFQDFHRYEFFMKDQLPTEKLYEMEFLNGIFREKGYLETHPLGKSYFNGVDLSGGEWQKITLARALYKNAALTVLDEPTSALDPVSEVELYKDFLKLVSKNSTSIMVTHRLNSIKMVEKVMILDKGQLIGFDTHINLINKNPLYKEMYLAQRSWYIKKGGDECVKSN